MKRTLLVVIIAVVAVMLLIPETASACAVCFGDKDSKMVKGANSGIFFLLTIIGLVQIGFVALFWSFWRRSKALQRRKEEFRLIEGGKAHA